MKKTILRIATVLAFISIGVLSSSYKAATIKKPGNFWYVEAHRIQVTKDEPDYVMSPVFEADNANQSDIEKQFRDQLTITFPKTHSFYELGILEKDYTSMGSAADALRGEEAHLAQMNLTYRIIDFTYYKK